MQDRPRAAELVAAVARLLENDVLAATDAPLRHLVRVAAHLCRVVERELALGAELELGAAQRLREVLRVAPDGRDAAALAHELADRLQADADPELERRAWPALVEIARGKLAVAKPGYDAWDFRTELDD